MILSTVSIVKFETLGSLINQLLSERNVSIEIIVVDDGSKGDILHIIPNIKDPHLVLLKQANLGVYAARNAALAIHRDELLFLLDANDDVGKGFVYLRWQNALAVQPDVMLFDGWRFESSDRESSVHPWQAYGK